VNSECILFLGPYKESQNRIVNYLVESGEMVIRYEKKLDYDRVHMRDFAFLISYGYRYIIEKKVLKCFDRRALNLHMSYLPWNKGADPNFWSILEDTPKGVTIHIMDERIDAGDILCQKEIFFEDNDTLRTSYEKLERTIETVFIKQWPEIKNDELRRVRQGGRGSYHKSGDKEKYDYLLSNGWDTKISEIQGKVFLR
tara:strand:+ start:61 stop:654 length:594 start_codon:yes stop_codon:yes gene_type:complete